MLFSLTKLFAQTAAVDLGTVNTVMAIEGRGITLNVPTAAAVYTDNASSSGVIAAGAEALRLHGRTPGGINVIYPMKDGVIADVPLIEQMLGQLFIKAFGKKRGAVGARLILCLPLCATGLERRALADAAKACGAREVIMLSEPLAAAAGAGLAVMEPIGSMVVDIGGGTTDAAVVSLGGIAAQAGIKTGGRHMDTAIKEYVAAQYGINIGEKTAEEIKLSLGAALIGGAERRQFKGRNIASGLPQRFTLSGGEVSHAIAAPVRKIIDAVKTTLSQTPPELAADIMDNGITLCGGGALLKGIDKLIAHETGLNVHIAEDPLYCVALGALSIGEDMDHSPAYTENIEHIV